MFELEGCTRAHHGGSWYANGATDLSPVQRSKRHQTDSGHSARRNRCALDPMIKLWCLSRASISGNWVLCLCRESTKPLGRIYLCPGLWGRIPDGPPFAAQHRLELALIPTQPRKHFCRVIPIPKLLTPKTIKSVLGHGEIKVRFDNPILLGWHCPPVAIL